MKKRFTAIFMAMLACISLFAACSGGADNSKDEGNSANTEQSIKQGGEEKNSEKEKTFTYGTTAYGVAMENAGLDPHNSYMGWSTLRYGVGETLFKFNESMQIEPWLAADYEIVDDFTVKIKLRDDVTFSNGKAMTGESVKKCLENLVSVHDRAPGDLDIKEISADGLSITIVSNQKVTGLINYLCDPYGCIIDIEAGVDENNNVIGTGPYIAESVTQTEINLTANDNYWGGEAKLRRVKVLSIPDGDTLTMALQAGEIDAAQGLPYASLALFNENADYKISSASTSRVYQAAFNFETEALKDLNVRKAICLAIDKEGFTSVLLNGNGTAAVGPFPANFTFGSNAVQGPGYDIEAAKQLLAESGWTDTDGDGIVDKNGKALELRWLTYTSRQELPLLAESAQATLKLIGIDLKVNATDNYNDFLAKGEFDIYAKAVVTAPSGDPQYYFTTHLLDSSAYNNGGYHSDTVERLLEELRAEFDTEKRSQLAIQIQQEVLNDSAFLYASHLKMSLVMKNKISGFEAHPSDYYEIGANLNIE